MSERRHELLFAGGAQEYNREGFSYVEGEPTLTLCSADSQRGERTRTLDLADAKALLVYLATVVPEMESAQQGGEDRD